MTKTKSFSIKNVPAELLEKAQRIAKEQDRQFSQVVRELLREYVAENEQKLEKKQPK